MICKPSSLRDLNAALEKVILDDQVFFVILPKSSNPWASADLLDSGSPLRCARNDGRLGPVGGKNLIIDLTVI